MSKRTRQYLGLLCAVVVYYLIHEGAHLIYALAAGALKQIRFMGFGMQIDIFRERLTDTQLGIFCLLGPAATQIAAWILTLLTDRITKLPSAPVKSCAYYVTLALLLLDPLYISILCGFFGGGDMNGISLLMPESAARIGFGCLLIFNGYLFGKILLPKYKAAFC